MKVAKVAQRPLAILVIITLQISSMGYVNEPPTLPYILKSGHISLTLREASNTANEIEVLIR